MQRRRPALGATRRKTADNHDFLPAGNVFGSPRQLRHAASFCPRCPCSQSSPSISFSFFSLFFIGFPTAIAKEANVRNSHFLGDPGAKTVLNFLLFFLVWQIIFFSENTHLRKLITLLVSVRSACEYPHGGHNKQGERESEEKAS